MSVLTGPIVAGVRALWTWRQRANHDHTVGTAEGVGVEFITVPPFLGRHVGAKESGDSNDHQCADQADRNHEK